MSVELLDKVTFALENKNISYLVIGGQAVLVHGRARLTNDIDIIIKATLNDVVTVKEICENLGLTYLDKNIESFVKKTMVMPVYDENSKFRVDIIFAFSDFELNAIERAIKVNIKNRDIKFASLEDLIVFKIFAGRAEDISDVEKLILINKTYDRGYILKWLGKFDEQPGLNLTQKYLEIERKL